MFVVKETSNPITDATQGINGLKIDHVAIFHHTDSADYALEAYGKAVSLTPLTKFLDRAKGKEGKPLIAVGRVIVDCDMATSMSRALSYLGRPYDHFYMPDDKEIYCSELVQEIESRGMKRDIYDWYLDTRKYGTCPHGGFGLGFERLILFVTGMQNIRDVIPFARTPKNAEF